MAPPAGTLRVGRYFLALGVLFAVLYGLVFLPGQSHTPKLGLDLVGGAQVVLQASTTNGSAPSKDAMNEARSIIQDRVDGRGVSNSQVAIEGADRITVTVPGKRADDIDNIGDTALLEFRPVVAGPFSTAPVATPTSSPSASTSPGASGSAAATGSATVAPTDATSASGAPTTAAGASPQDAAARPLTADTPTASAAATSAAAPATSAAASSAAAATSAAAPAGSAAPTAPAGSAAPTAPAGSAPPTAAPSVPGAADVTAAQLATFVQQNASVPGASTLTEDQTRALIAYRCGTDKPDPNPNAVIVTCDTAGTAKYLLNAVLFPGTEVSGATAVAPSSNNIGWTVQLKLKSGGQKTWADYTEAHHNPDPTGNTPDTDPTHFVAFTLDGTVITAPNINSTITGDTTISGSFTEASATQLANSLKYGALPLSFKELTSQTVSATLGTAQLKAGLLAGGIGLVLVVIYSLLYYRGLGLVTLASLVVSGGIVYAALVILGRQIGFTLTLAGVAGFIVAVGITADSFVVFFERIKDEVHEGRSMRVAVPRAWIRARRTVISADIVSLLAATVLYLLAAGDVRGFAFTLGLSTIIDLVVVFWFTHPLVSLLSRSRTFGSKRFTGLDSVRGRTVLPEGPARSARPARAARPARPTGTAGTITVPRGSGATAAGGGVAVLDREDDVVAADDTGTGARDVTVTPDVPVTPDATVTPEVEPAVAGTVAEPGTSTGDGTDTPHDDTPDETDGTAGDADTGGRARGIGAVRPRRGGGATAADPATSAAERAAARRARLRSSKEDGQ